jgi:hypothetical protein
MHTHITLLIEVVKKSYRILGRKFRSSGRCLLEQFVVHIFMTSLIPNTVEPVTTK